MSKKLIVDAETKGKRFDTVASQLFPRLSRSYVRSLIVGKRILYNGDAQKPGFRVREGDEISSDFDESEIEKIADIDLPILYEDNNVMVISKPIGVISHSRGKFWNEPSVASFIRQKTGQEGERAGIIHRLDRATSGVMICAKNSQTLSFLQKQFSSRKVQKTYIAVVSGHMKLPSAIIDMPIERNPKRPTSFRVSSNGKPSQTKYTVVEHSQNCDVLRLEPLTGRTHQLRVHLANQGHPIRGDELYGGEKSERLYLHAQSITIKLPEHGIRTFEAPLPESFKI